MTCFRLMLLQQMSLWWCCTVVLFLKERGKNHVKANVTLPKQRFRCMAGHLCPWCNSVVFSRDTPGVNMSLKASDGSVRYNTIFAALGIFIASQKRSKHSVCIKSNNLNIWCREKKRILDSYSTDRLLTSWKHSLEIYSKKKRGNCMSITFILFPDLISLVFEVYTKWTYVEYCYQLA